MKKSDANKVLKHFKEMQNPRQPDRDIESDRKRLRKLMMGKRK